MIKDNKVQGPVQVSEEYKKASPEYQLARDLENGKNARQRTANSDPNKNKKEAELEAREEERLNAEQNVAQVKSSNQQSKGTTQGASLEVNQSKDKNNPLGKGQKFNKNS